VTDEEAMMRTLAGDLGFTEGPLITERGEIVCVSISEGMLHHISSDGSATVLADLGGGPNGACPGPNGEIYVAQNGGNWMVGGGKGVKTESGVQAVRARDGDTRWVTTLPLAPNDLCFGPDGALYVTDPTRRPTYDDGRIWRYLPETDRAEIVYEVPWFPNGIAFGPEEDVMYVASTGDGKIIRLPLRPSSASEKGELFAQVDPGHPDGMAFDTAGNLLVGANSHSDAPGTVQVFDRGGALVETIHIGPSKRYTNLAISGDGVIVVTDSDRGALRAIDGWRAPGLALYPRRHEHEVEPALAPALRTLDLAGKYPLD
jgi:gluconolactonase